MRLRYLNELDRRRFGPVVENFSVVVLVHKVIERHMGAGFKKVVAKESQGQRLFPQLLD